MGGILSNSSKHQQQMCREHSPPPRCLNDPRSPSEGIDRTPIVVDKKPYLETNIDALTPAPLRVRVLKMNFDPRSPSAGVVRTPITTITAPDQSSSFSSPVSLYSNYQSEVGSCLPSPAEPSVNVSDFGNELDSLVDKLEVSESDIESPLEKPSKLSFRTSPMDNASTKKICEDLIVEIIESFKECQVQLTEAQLQQSTTKALSIAKESDAANLPGLRLKKTRKPLSNITSSAGNTPTKMHVRKSEKFVPVEMLGENSPVSHKLAIKKDRGPKKAFLHNDENSCYSTPPRQNAQWSHDSTVII